MSDVIYIADFKKKKTKEKRRVPETSHGPSLYDGKLGDAMRKFGSATGNVMKEQFKKKDKLSEDDNVI